PRAASRAHQRRGQGARHPAHQSLSKDAVAAGYPTEGVVVTRPRAFLNSSGNLLLSGEHMRLLALLLILVTAMPVSPFILTSVAQAELASVGGTATSSAGETLVNATVQLRD